MLEFPFHKRPEFITFIFQAKSKRLSLSDTLFDLQRGHSWLRVNRVCVYRPVKLQPSLFDYEHPDHESNQELEDEDDPASHHVVWVSDHLLHASQGRPDVYVQCLGREQAQHASQDIALGWETENQLATLVQFALWTGPAGPLTLTQRTRRSGDQTARGSAGPAPPVWRLAGQRWHSGEISHTRSAGARTWCDQQGRAWEDVELLISIQEIFCICLPCKVCGRWRLQWWRWSQWRLYHATSRRGSHMLDWSQYNPGKNEWLDKSQLKISYPDNWEADQGVQGHEYNKDSEWWLELSPQEDSVDVVSHIVHGEHQEDAHHHPTEAPHQNVCVASFDPSWHILAVTKIITFLNCVLTFCVLLLISWDLHHLWLCLCLWYLTFRKMKGTWPDSIIGFKSLPLV